MTRTKHFSVTLLVLLVAVLLVSACGGAQPTVDTAAVDAANAKAATAEAKLAAAEAALADAESAGGDVQAGGEEEIAAAKATAEAAQAEAQAAQAEAEAAQAEAAEAMANVKPVEITMWTLTFEAEREDIIKEIADEFEANNPGIIINIEPRAVDAHKDAMRVTIGSAGAPDIYFMWAGLGLGGEFVLAGASAPLDEAYAEYGWDDRFVEAALANSKLYLNERHGVPFNQHPQALYYRKDLFEQAGITDLPTTYDELIAVNDQLVAAGIPPITFGGSVNWHLMRLMDNILEAKCGAETHDALKAMEASWADEPCATDAFVEFKKWVDNYIYQPFMGIAQDDSQQLWFNGEAAMMLEGDWHVGSIKATDQDPDNIGIFAFPTGTGRIYYFVEMWYVGASSRHKEEAVEWLDYFMSPEVQQEYVGDFGAIPVVKGLTFPDDQHSLDAEWNDLITQFDATFVNGDQAFPLAVTTEYFRIHNSIATGDLDPTEAGAEMQTFIDNYKAEQSSE
jgi:raffinose/stachyose/melibiose transport system substrate-binding protein